MADETENPAPPDQPPPVPDRRSGRRPVYDGLVAADHFIETNPVIRLLGVVAAVIGFVVLLFTAYQIYVDINDRKDERENRRQERLARAWETLSRPIAGDSGKGEAISTIFREQDGNINIDIRCASKSIFANECAKKTILNNIEIFNYVPFASKFYSEFDYRVEYADITNGKIENSIVSKIYFKSARFINGVIINSRIDSESSATTFEFSKIIDSIFRIRGEYSFLLTEISGTVFFTHDGIKEISGYLIYASADNPPFYFDTKAGARIIENISYCIPQAQPENFGPVLVGDALEGCTPTITMAEARARYPEAWDLTKVEKRFVEPRRMLP